MKEDVASLQELHDLVEAQGVDWFPLAPGAYGILSALFLFALFLLWKAWGKRRGNLYRNEALLALERSGTALDVSVILKRCAKLNLSSNELSAFTPQQWIAFLGSCGPAMPEALQRTWHDWVYSGADAEELQLMKNYAMQWVREHHFEGKAS